MFLRHSGNSWNVTAAPPAAIYLRRRATLKRRTICSRSSPSVSCAPCTGRARRGRFRDFLKGVLYHMAADFHKKARKQAVPLGPDHPEPAAPSLSEHDETFLNSWRDDLLARAWDDLQREERATGRPCYAVLRFCADNPDMPSAMMAANLSSQLGTELSAAAVRQSLHRARDASPTSFSKRSAMRWIIAPPKRSKRSWSSWAYWSIAARHSTGGAVMPEHAE